jgi:hypothetical protein
MTNEDPFARPEDDLESTAQTLSDHFMIDVGVLAPIEFVQEYHRTHPPDIEQRDVVDVEFEEFDRALTKVFFKLASEPETFREKLGALTGRDYRAVRGALERWKSACQEAFGGVGPLPEAEAVQELNRHEAGEPQEPE